MRRLHLITPLALGLLLTAPLPAAHAQLGIGLSITIMPPALPIYVQPPIPAPGYIWMPGYWAYGPDGYYWVPGTWVLPPAIGLLWTPGYWAWRDGFYVWIPGYWGLHVGFYGGINYGFGYFGSGYDGGYWREGRFFYNHSVNNFGGVHITNFYSRTVVGGTAVNRVSFNGGAGGVNARPTPQEAAFANERHDPPTAIQTQHQQSAAGNRALLASTNHGQPSIAATSRPNEFTGHGVVGARPSVTPAVTGVHPGGTAGQPAGHPGPAGGAGGTGPLAHPQVTPPHPPTGGTGAGGAHPATVAPHPAPPPPHPAAPPPHPAAPPPHPAAPPPHKEDEHKQ